jgi:hypothetical protein
MKWKSHFDPSRFSAAAHGRAAGRLYEILMRRDVNRNRKLTSPGGTKPAGKEAFMLDLAFIVLGSVVIAMMCLYAVGLRQL